MTKRNILILLAAALTLNLVGCGDQSMEAIPGAGSLGETARPIYGGSPPDQEMHKAVVSLHQVVNGTQVYVSPFCTGTLIKGDVVLTAAHCLTTTKGKKVKAMAPTALAVYVGDNPSTDLLQHLYLVQELKVHSQYNASKITNDIALIRLNNAVTEPVTPVPALPTSLGLTSADIGATVNFAGFGDTEKGTSGVKLQADGTIAGLGCTVEGCPDGGVAATQFSYAQPNSGPCFGDSGGPAFLYRSGAPYVAGITSYGDSYCTVYGVSTRTDAFDSWISAFANPPDCSANGECNPACAPGDDPDCASSCLPAKAACESNGDCCSGNCHAKRGVCR